MSDLRTYTVHQGCDHIFFVGFMGAGKTTLARNLGRLFNRPYKDTDKLVARLACSTVGDLYREEGERAYRLREEDALRRLLDDKSVLVSCGDGIIERPENVELMRQMGKIVFIDIDFEGALSQIKNYSARPLLEGSRADHMLFERRRPLYQSVADYTVDIRDLTFEQVAYKVGNLLWEEGLL